MIGYLGRYHMKVRVYYSRDCPNLDTTVALVREVASDNDLNLDLEIREIRSEEEGIVSRFQGSPTVQVDGSDIEPEVREKLGIGSGCRLYGTSGVPNRKLIEDALLEEGGQ
jgi:hypothetical protein